MGKGDKVDKKIDRKLYDAVKQEKLSEIEKYLESGANPEAPVGRNGKTTMMRASNCKNRDVEKLLQTKSRSGTLARSESLVSNGSDAISSPDSPGPGGAGVGTFVAKGEPWAMPSEGSISIDFQISRLADGVGSSLRMKRRVAPNSVEDLFKPEDELKQIATASNEKNWEFDRKKLRQVRKLGQGTFGIVFEGLAEDLLPSEKQTRVAVKMLSAEGSDVKQNFTKEVQIMKAIDGPHNIVRLLGVCTEIQPFLMIMELMDRGDLKTVLRENRPKELPSPLSYSRIAKMGADIAEGMGYLASCHIVHRDLAARNCLVAQDFTVKIGDFGLTRDVEQGEYYRMTGSAPLPIRWMSPEAIMDGVYSTQSDVWSFGVVLWELLTFAKLPYQGLSNAEVCDAITDEEYRLPMPRGCPPELYQVALKCWVQDPAGRNSFQELRRDLEALAPGLSKEGIGKEKPRRKSENPDRDYLTIEEPEAAAEEAYTRAKAEPTYLKEEDKYASPTLYVDERYTHLSSMSQALKVAEQQRGIVQFSVPASGANPTIVSRSVKEETLAADSIPNAAAASGTADQGRGSAPKVGVAKRSSQRPRAGSEPVLPGAAPFSVTQAVAPVPPSAPAPAPAPAPAANPAAATSATLTPAANTPTPPPERSATLGSPASIWGRQHIPQKEMQSQPPPMPRAFSESPKMSRKFQGGSTSRKHLANDNSAIADKVREASSQIADKAEKDVYKWIETVLGIKMQGNLHEALRSGEVLCSLVNKLKPGTIKKFHPGSRMAFRQMENIGWFLEACKELGVPDTDLFMTVDLFDATNMRQVVICINSFKLKAT